jgi:general secretion pathway protein L
MAQRILGLDLGSRRVKVVLLETTLRGFVVAEAAEVAVPEASEGRESLLARQAAALREALAGPGRTFDAAVAAVPGVAATHLVSLPFADARRIEQTVQYEVEAAIPFELEQVAWDWQPLSTQPGRSELLVNAVRRSELEALLAELGAAGVDPALVVPPAPTLAALWAAGAVADPAPDGEAELAVDLGGERTNVCVVSQGRCLFARSFPGGTAPALRAAAREPAPAGPATSAAPSPPRDALPPDSGTEAAMRRALGPLVRELRATLRAYESRPLARPVRLLRLAGGGAELEGLAPALAADLEIRVEPLRLQGPAAQRIGPDRAAGLALPLALALRGWLGSRFQRLNLRRGGLASRRGFQDLKQRLVRLSVYGALVLLLALVGTGVKVVALARQETLLDRSLCEVTQKVVGKCFDDFSVAESVLRGRGTAGASIPRVSAAGVLAELAARTPSVALRFDRIEIGRDKLHLQGTTDAAENVDRIVAALRASRCFADARSGGARRRGAEAKFEFTIDADVSCEGAAAPGGKG